MTDFLVIINVEACIKKDDKYLFIKRHKNLTHTPNTISFVGGRVEFTGEKFSILEENLKREIKEEVGIKVSNIEYVCSNSFISDKGSKIVNMVFKCDYEDGKARIVASEEVSEVLWLTEEEVINNENIKEYTKDYFKKALAR